MKFSQCAPLVGALFAGLTAAKPAAPYSPKAASVATRSAPATFDLTKSWEDAILFAGVAAPPIVGVQSAVQLGIRLPQAAVSGSVAVSMADSFLLDPVLRVELSGVKAYLELDLSTSASVLESIELVASEKLSLAVPGLLEVDIGAGFALDLVLGINAALDINAGVYVTLPEDAFLEINVLTQEIVKVNLEGLVAQALPIGLGAEIDISAAVQLDVGLRLRSEIVLGAGLDILGLQLGAGADVAVWINLFDYTTAFSSTSACALVAEEAFSLTAGVAVELDVEVLGALDLSLAPSVVVSLATAQGGSACLTSGSYTGAFGPGGLLGGHSNSTAGAHGSSPNDASSGNSTSGASTSASAASAASATGNSKGNSGQGTSGQGDGAQDGAASASVTATSSGALVSSTASPVSGNGSWNGTSDAAGSDGLVTSTTTTTATYTITSCAWSVTNCPKSHTQQIITSTVIVRTTVCPATMTATSTHGSNSTLPTSTSKKPHFPTPTVGTTVTVAVCPSPTTSTYTPPTDVPTQPATVTIEDTTTICPATETETAASSTSVPQGPPQTTAPVPTGTGSWTPSKTPSGYTAPPTPTSTLPVTAGASANRVAGLAGVLALMAWVL